MARPSACRAKDTPPSPATCTHGHSLLGYTIGTAHSVSDVRKRCRRIRPRRGRDVTIARVIHWLECQRPSLGLAPGPPLSQSGGSESFQTHPCDLGQVLEDPERRPAVSEGTGCGTGTQDATGSEMAAAAEPSPNRGRFTKGSSTSTSSA